MTIEILKTEVKRSIKNLEVLNSSNELYLLKLSTYREILEDIQQIEKKDFFNKIGNLALTS